MLKLELGTTLGWVGRVICATGSSGSTIAETGIGTTTVGWVGRVICAAGSSGSTIAETGTGTTTVGRVGRVICAAGSSGSTIRRNWNWDDHCRKGRTSHSCRRKLSCCQNSPRSRSIPTSWNHVSRTSPTKVGSRASPTNPLSENGNSQRWMTPTARKGCPCRDRPTRPSSQSAPHLYKSPRRRS